MRRSSRVSWMTLVRKSAPPNGRVSPAAEPTFTSPQRYTAELLTFELTTVLIFDDRQSDLKKAPSVRCKRLLGRAADRRRLQMHFLDTPHACKERLAQSDRDRY